VGIPPFAKGGFVIQSVTKLQFHNIVQWRSSWVLMEELLCHMTISSMAIRLASVERVIVIAVPFVATLIFSPDTKPSAASHFPFSRMLGTMHSFLRCGWPHSRYKLETVSVRAVDFVVVMPITRGKQAFSPCSHVSGLSVVVLHRRRASWHVVLSWMWGIGAKECQSNPHFWRAYPLCGGRLDF
jgi:hypothetical protein